ncbi:MAG: hypothetical protein ACKOZW_13645 [Cyanobium sp.]
MSHVAIAAHGLLIAWVECSIDPGEEGCTGSPSLVVEAQMPWLAEALPGGCSLQRREGWLDASPAAEADQGLRRWLEADRRWATDKRCRRHC